MFRILAGLIIFVALIGGLLLQVSATQAQEADTQPVAILAVQSEQLLAATLQISVQARIAGEDSVGYGLGTLVRSQGKILILTHNHWGPVLDDLSLIEFRDARGNLLIRTMGREINNLIRYQDEGTLVLAAPPALLDKIDPAAALTAGLATRAQKNAVVQIAYRLPDQRDRVALQEAVVELNGQCPGEIACLKLRSLDGQPLQKGDSGGGVFLNGALVANNWISVTADTPQEIADAGALLQVGEHLFTDMSYAASLPASALAGQLAGQP
jgi:hypothetical protein